MIFIVIVCVFIGIAKSTSPLVSDDCPPLSPNMDALTQDQFTNKLTASCRYDKLIKPPTIHPLPVYVQIDLTHIESTDQVQFKAHMLVQYRYSDKRLIYKHLSPNRGVVLGEELLRNKIWVPHLFIRNERDTKIMGIDGKDMFVLIEPDGHIVYSYRMSVTFYCWMNLKKFPFDSQDCDLRWNSWTYNSSSLKLHWDNASAVKVSNNLHLTEFVLTKTYMEEKDVPAAFTKGAFVGNYSELVFRFKLCREVGYYIMDYFLPSILLVCTSWVTFWLQADSSPARTALGTSTMLAFITLNGGLTKNLPKVSYIKASEIWFLGCACFIFGSMAEFAFVNVIWRRKKKVELIKQTGKHILFGALTPSIARKQVIRKAESMGSLYKPYSCSSIESDNKLQNYLTVQSLSGLKLSPLLNNQDYMPKDEDNVTRIEIDGTQSQYFHTMTPHEVSNWIDKKSRIFFPLAFVVFNIFYWTFVYAV